MNEAMKLSIASINIYVPRNLYNTLNTAPSPAGSVPDQHARLGSKRPSLRRIENHPAKPLNLKKNPLPKPTSFLLYADDKFFNVVY